MSIDKKVENIIHSMTLEEKIGQLFILAFPGKDSHVACEMIQNYGIGGCYISQDNAETFEEAQKLTASLQATAHSGTVKLPLILGVDQEGAWGVLIPESTIGPGNLALGILDDTRYTHAIYSIFAQEMRSVGYQTILGPCADVNINPQNPIIGTRSFGEDPTRVAAHVAAAVIALKNNGVLATAKHFPGHGDTQSDTHRDIPVVDKSLQLLKRTELLPFQAAIDAGVDIIMTSHILYPHIDPDYPATLSPAILGGLLRETMGFSGIVITDSMNMGAIRKHYSPEDATVCALKAGADLVMLSEEHYDHNVDYRKNQAASIMSVRNAVKNGIISESVLNEKLARIVTVKLRICDDAQVPLPSAEEKKNMEIQAARASIRVLKNTNQALPLHKGESIAVINATPQSSYHNLMNSRGIGPNQSEPAFNAFVRAFSPRWGDAIDVFSHEDMCSICDEDMKKLRAYDKCVVITEDYPLPGEDFDKVTQIALVQEITHIFHSKTIVMALRSPYDLLLFPDIGCYACAYSSRTCSADAAAAFLAHAL